MDLRFRNDLQDVSRSSESITALSYVPNQINNVRWFFSRLVAFSHVGKSFSFF